MLLKFKPELNLKFMLKWSKTIKIIKRSKIRRGLTQVKAIFSANYQTRNIDILTTRISTLKNIVSGCLVLSEHRIDILNAKSIGEVQLTYS